MKPVATTSNAIALVEPRNPELLHVEPRSDLVRVEKMVVASLLDVDELAAVLQVSRWSIYRWSTAGRIPFVAAGRNKRFILDEVVAALRDGRCAQREQAPPTAAVAPRRVPPVRPTLAAPPPRREQPTDEADRIRAVVAATRRLGESK